MKLRTEKSMVFCDLFDRIENMNWWEALILGLVQGVSEFLPISSTAHIVLTQKLLGLSFPGLAMEIFLHMASALALILYFRKDLIKLIRSFFSFLVSKKHEDKSNFFFCVYILVATLMTGVLGVLLKDYLDQNLKTPLTISMAFFVTAFFLVYVERIRRTQTRDQAQMTAKDSLWIGLAQSVAIIPGISRSGSTLVAALLVGLNKDTAIRYSFLLALPVILGSSVLGLKDWNEGALSEGVTPFVLFVSFASSFLASLAGIRWLIRFVQSSRLYYFAIYCVVLAIMCLLAGHYFVD
jgi:undecaprenyl-diphosphatase